jgi:hypothetical protein
VITTLHSAWLLLAAPDLLEPGLPREAVWGVVVAGTASSAYFPPLPNSWMSSASIGRTAWSLEHRSANIPSVWRQLAS